MIIVIFALTVEYKNVLSVNFPNNELHEGGGGWGGGGGSHYWRSLE